VNVLIQGLLLAAYVFAEFVHSLKVYTEFVIHSSAVCCWSYCPQLRFIYHVMEYFPKSLVFWKGESSALAILLKEEGEPCFQEKPPIFLSEDPNTCYPVESGVGSSTLQ